MYFSSLGGVFGLPRVPEGPLTDRHYAIAATGQERLEQVLFSLHTDYIMTPAATRSVWQEA